MIARFSVLAGALLLSAAAPSRAQAPRGPEPVFSKVEIHGMAVDTARPPSSLATQEALGVIAARPIGGQIIHWARDRGKGLFETRAIITPAGDYLLMFPDGAHYGGSSAKANDMLAYRSSDGGRTWTGPKLAFDIDYNQHGFIPLIPHGATVAFSGFTNSGAAKLIPRAIAARALALHEKGEPYQIRVLTGASTSESIDEPLAEAEAISWRAPYQSAPRLRRQINSANAAMGNLGFSAIYTGNSLTDVLEGRGEGGAFTEDGNLEWPNGRLPTNTSGGGI